MRDGLWQVWAAVWVAMAMVWSPAAFAADVPTFVLEGEWKASTLPGHTPSHPTYWTWQDGAAATWRPAFTGPVQARVWMHVVAHENNQPSPPVTVTDARGTHEVAVDFAGPTGWREMGTFSFAGGPNDAVRLESRRGAEPNRVARASAVRFDMLGSGADAEVIGTLMMDEVTDAAGRTVRVVPVKFADFGDAKDHPAAVAIGRLATRGIAMPLAPNRFDPEAPLTRGEFAVWLARVLKRVPLGDPRKLTPATDEERRAALAALPEMGEGPADAAMTGEQVERVLAGLAGREDWRDALPDEEREQLAAAAGAPRGWAALILHRFMQHVLQPGPPTPGEWRLTFADEFNESAIDTEVWSVEAGSPGHIQSSRWPENVVLEHGLLRLLTRREERGGKQWTTGNISTKVFRQQYGYFECRMRIGAATGLNNAFWLMTWKKPTDPNHFEIDIAETKYPSRNHVTLHNWSGEHTAQSKLWATSFDLSEDFHLYAAEWTPDEVVWYVDGEEIFRVQHDFARAPAPLRLSSAVAPFAGAIVDALDGTSMDVDWVRAYARDGE